MLISLCASKESENMQVDISGGLQKSLINSRIFWRILVSSNFASRVWGRHAPTRSLGKLARVWEVTSQWSTEFSRIKNLWPRGGPCPLHLRSKRVFGDCFRIVKAQKISRGGSTPAMGSPFVPNEVPAPVLQWRWRKIGITFGRLMKFSRCGSHKRRIPLTQRSNGFCRVNRRQNELGVLRGG